MLKRASTATLFLLLLLVACEVTAHVWIAHFASPESFTRFASLRQLQARSQASTDLSDNPGLSIFTRHRYLGYVATPGWTNGPNRHNSLGYRGAEIAQPKPPDEIRVVCVGGSTTYTSVVKDHEAAYPAVLQRELIASGHPNVRVINAGLHAWTTWESLINLQLRVLELDPDVVVVYHGFNDIKPRFVWPPKHYLPDNSGYRVTTPSIFLPSPWEQSSLARILMTEAGAMTPHAELERTLDERTPYSYWSKFRGQLLSGRYPQGLFTKVGVEQLLDANPPRYFERNLELVSSVARQAGIDLVLASFALRIDGIGGSNEGTQHLERAMAEMNGVVAEVAARTGADFFDFAEQMPLDEAYFADHIHVTEAGAEVKGRLFAKFLSEHVLDG